MSTTVEDGPSRTQAIELPTELITEIVAIIADDASNAEAFSALTAASLVSRVWNTICRPHVFRTLSFSYQNTDARLSFLHFEAPHLSGYVRELHLGWRRVYCTPSEWLPECFGRLKNLRELHLEHGIMNLSMAPPSLAAGIRSMLAAPRLRKLSLHYWAFVEDSSDLLSMLPSTLEELSLQNIEELSFQNIILTDAENTLPSTTHLQALRSLHLAEIFHPMLRTRTFALCPNLDCLRIRWSYLQPWDLPSWIPATLTELTLDAKRVCNIPDFGVAIQPSVLTINLASYNDSYPEMFTWANDCIDRLPFPELIQKLTIGITNRFTTPHSNTEELLPQPSDYAMLFRFLQQLCVSGRLKSIVLWITVSVDLVEGILDVDEGLQVTKLETGFAELLNKKVLDVHFTLERTLFAGVPPEVELAIMLPRVE